MAADRVGRIEELLHEAEQAHGRYEAAELNGVYDAEWARWYATFAVEHGIGPILGRDVSTDELAAFLSSGFADFEASEPKPAESWAAYLARRIAAELRP
jgi:hypothetical protein